MFSEVCYEHGNIYMYHASFCLILDKVRASLVEPWFIFWRDHRSSQNTHGETKQALKSSRIKQKLARLHVYEP